MFSFDENRKRLTIIVGLFFLCLNASAESRFSYSISLNEAGYDMLIEMQFPSTLSFAAVIANWKNPRLQSEFNSQLDPTEIRPLSAGKFDSILSFRTMGLRTKMLSHCEEKVSNDEWQRSCELDVKELDAAKYMERKTDQVFCRKERGETSCRFSAVGKLKPVFFLSAESLTVRAKVQALINWGRFFFYTNSGSVSSRYSNAEFDHSSIIGEIEHFKEEALQVSKAGAPFSYQTKKTFLF